MKSTAIVFFHAACKMNKKKEMIAEGNQFSFSGRERPFFFGEIYMITPPFRHLSAMMTKRSYELVWLGRSSIENSNVSEISSHVKFDVWLQSHQGRPTNRKKAPMMAEKKWLSPYRRDEEFNFLFWTFVSHWSIVIPCSGILMLMEAYLDWLMEAWYLISEQWIAWSQCSGIKQWR